MSSEQESPKSRVAGLVAGHQSLICGELHHPSGLQASGLSGAGLVLICCKVGFENNLEKLQEGGVSPHANAGRHVPPVRNVSTYGCGYEIFPGVQDGEEWDS